MPPQPLTTRRRAAGAPALDSADQIGRAVLRLIHSQPARGPITVWHVRGATAFVVVLASSGEADIVQLPGDPPPRQGPGKLRSPTRRR